MNNYLFISAHFDDIEVCAMGTLLKLLETNNNIYFMVMSRQRDDTVYNIRRQEQENVIKQLVVYKNLFYLDEVKYYDGLLMNHTLDMRDIIEKVMAKYFIDTVFCTFEFDTHPDHVAVSKAVDMAARQKSVIQYETPNAFNFIPNYFVPLSNEDVTLKIRLMKIHRSQNDKNNNFYLDKIRATAIFRGQAIYEQFAEAFFIKRLKHGIYI